MPPSPVRQMPKAVARPAKRGVIDRIKPLSFDDVGIKILLYGRSGTGKTTLWGSFPGPTLAIVCSGGVNSGELRSLDTPANRGKIKCVDLEHSTELKTVARWAKTQKFGTIVLDHVSGLQDLTLKEILGLEEIPAQKTWGLATQQQYGQSTLQCKELLRELINLDANVVLIGHERSFKDDGESEVMIANIGVGVTPALAGWVNGAVDYVCQTFLRQKEVARQIPIKTKDPKTKKEVIKHKTIMEKTDGVDFCLRAGPSPTFMTKFRLPRGAREIPDVIIDPDYTKIYNLVKGVQ